MANDMLDVFEVVAQSECEVMPHSGDDERYPDKWFPWRLCERHGEMMVRDLIATGLHPWLTTRANAR